MKIEIRKSFQKDALKLPDEIKTNLSSLLDAITNYSKFSQIPNLKKLSGSRNAYRIRIGQYRVGFFYIKGVIELVRILDRKDIYKYFP